MALLAFICMSFSGILGFFVGAACALATVQDEAPELYEKYIKSREERRRNDES